MTTRARSNPAGARIPLTRESLERWYVRDGLSIQEIALKTGYGWDTVQRHLVAAGIPRRAVGGTPASVKAGVERRKAAGLPYDGGTPGRSMPPVRKGSRDPEQLAREAKRIVLAGPVSQAELGRQLGISRSHAGRVLRRLEAAGEVPPRSRSQAARAGGLKGGPARAAKLSPDRRKQIAASAARARHQPQG